VILAIDPGIRGTGAALFDGQELVAADYVVGSPTGNGADAWLEILRTTHDFVKQYCYDRDTRVTETVVECPQVYTASHSKGDPNDLIPLAAIDGAVCGAYWALHRSKATSYLPAQWKGQTPKAVHHNRIKALLTEQEKARCVFPRETSLHHNVWDAVALGMFHVGRTKRGGAKP
jgi:hypothetical protein